LLAFLEEKEQRSSKEQSKFRLDLLRAHSGWDEDNMNIYCPVVQMYMDQKRVKAAHVYPYSLGTTVMAMLFGDSSIAELFSTHNGLLLADFIEDRFYKHQVVVVPAEEAKLHDNGIIDHWDLRVVDDSVRGAAVTDLQCKLRDLDGRELCFKTNAQAAAWYLYFHYRLATLRAKKGTALYAASGTAHPLGNPRQLHAGANGAGPCHRRWPRRFAAAEHVMRNPEGQRSRLPTWGEGARRPPHSSWIGRRDRKP
jgi:hypothetical protein